MYIPASILSSSVLLGTCPSLKFDRQVKFTLADETQSYA